MSVQSASSPTSAHPGAAEPILCRGFIRDEMIGADLPFAEISRLLFEGRIVVLKGVFDHAAAIAFRQAVHSWGRTTPAFANGKSPSLFPELNYHRIDDGSYRSLMPHIFHQYGLSRIDTLDEPLCGIARRVATLMVDLQNKVAGTNLPLSPQALRLKALHYPAGGGYLVEHAHEIEPQRIGLILSLSAIGEEIEQGGTVFATPFGRVDVAPCHDLGDVVLFRVDIPHGIPPIDVHKKIDWNSEAGKWSIVLDLRDTYSQKSTVT